MKRPNNLFQKKYISSLVIAAFLILSVLTAYNIKIGNADGGKSDNKTKTETTEKSNDVIGPVSGNDTGSATNSADSAANNDMDVEPGAEGQNGTDTLDSNAEDNGEGTKYSNNSGRNSSSEQDDADTKDENNTKNNISGTKENAGNNAENSGASANNLLMQMQADISGAPVNRPVCVETTAMGAAYLAGLSVGYWKSTDDIRKNWSVDRTFDPEITQNERDSKVRMWKKAVSYSFNWDK